MKLKVKEKFCAHSFAKHLFDSVLCLSILKWSCTYWCVAVGRLGDLWKLTVTGTGARWNWVDGSSSANYGGSTVSPSGRRGPACWIHPTTHELYMYGGHGRYFQDPNKLGISTYFSILSFSAFEWWFFRIISWSKIMSVCLCVCQTKNKSSKEISNWIRAVVYCRNLFS